MNARPRNLELLLGYWRGLAGGGGRKLEFLRLVGDSRPLPRRRPRRSFPTRARPSPTTMPTTGKASPGANC